MGQLQNIIKVSIFNKLRFLKISELELPHPIINEFEEIYEKGVSKGNGSFIDYRSKYPKYLFLNYLIEHKNILVHGSNYPDLGCLEPRHQSLFNGKPVTAVFAASDGVWSLFFAVFKRKDYVGSLRNLCLTVPTYKGIKRYYYFSVNQDFNGQYWTDGTIYLLPKGSFKQGGIKDEWISENKVTPMAKLSVTPNDFPFLKKIYKHQEKDSIVKTMVKSLILKR